MSLEQLLLSTPPNEWRTRRAIVFDWYDGPRQGVCELATPAATFAFEVIAEYPTDDDLDDRFYRVSALRTDAIVSLEEALAPTGTPSGPIWVPVWRFTDETSRHRADDLVAAVLASRGPTEIAIHSRDLQRFLGCWRIPTMSEAATDWASLRNDRRSVERETPVRGTKE